MRKNKFEVGDRVKFVRLLSVDPKRWYMTQEEFDILKEYVNKVGTITAVEKHYKKKGFDYFIDVSFSSGYKMSRANSIAFEKVDFDFDLI
tara:strand:+ start:66 stop:335 length:270 start_codon:yes stop_codon:yes gene_type:complete